MGDVVPRAAEEAGRGDARESELLGRVADAAPALLSYVGNDRCFRYVNRAYGRWFVQPVAAIVGRPVADFLGEEAYQLVGPYVDAALAGERISYEMLVPYLRGPRHIHAELVPDFDADGTVRGFVSVITDVSRSKASETERARLIQELQVERIKQHVFMRDVLAIVTDGKLRLCDADDDLPPPVPWLDLPIRLTETEGLWALRRRVAAAAQLAAFPEARAQDFITAVSEAGMNAIVHAGGGEARVGTDSGSCLQARIRDEGAGILMENLPRAALKRGFSTKNTLGHGLKMMLETVDRLFIRTGDTGTTIILEKDREEPTPLWLQDDPP